MDPNPSSCVDHIAATDDLPKLAKAQAAMSEVSPFRRRLTVRKVKINSDLMSKRN